MHLLSLLQPSPATFFTRTIHLPSPLFAEIFLATFFRDKISRSPILHCQVSRLFATPSSSHTTPSVTTGMSKILSQVLAECTHHCTSNNSTFILTTPTRPISVTRVATMDESSKGEPFKGDPPKGESSKGNSSKGKRSKGKSKSSRGRYSKGKPALPQSQRRYLVTIMPQPGFRYYRRNGAHYGKYLLTNSQSAKIALSIRKYSAGSTQEHFDKAFEALLKSCNDHVDYCGIMTPIAFFELVKINRYKWMRELEPSALYGLTRKLWYGRSSILAEIQRFQDILKTVPPYLEKTSKVTVAIDGFRKSFSARYQGTPTFDLYFKNINLDEALTAEDFSMSTKDVFEFRRWHGLLDEALGGMAKEETDKTPNAKTEQGMNIGTDSNAAEDNVDAGIALLSEPSKEDGPNEDVSAYLDRTAHPDNLEHPSESDNEDQDRSETNQHVTSTRPTPEIRPATNNLKRQNEQDAAETNEQVTGDQFSLALRPTASSFKRQRMC